MTIETALNQRMGGAAENLLHGSAVPGAAVAVIVDGHPVLEAGIGSADLACASPLESDAQFYIYSITKTLTAIATLQLAEQGRVALDGPIQTYLPDLALPESVTVRRLLNHTGGISDYGGKPEYHETVRSNPSQPWTSAEFLERTLSTGPAYEPGQGWGYSNIGYLILKLLLQQVHGRPLCNVFHKAIFEPLDLQRTFVAEDLTDASALTPGHSAYFSIDGELSDVTSRYHPGWVSHGVVISTAPEIARIFEALFAGRVLDTSSLAAMLEPVLVPAEHPLFSQPAYGLGLMIDAGSPYGRVAGHGGGGPGYSTGAIHLPDVNGRRVTSVALVNADLGDLGLPIAFALAEQVAASTA
jgi:D-alanyl-D-alanine carboxypeptidase